MNETRYAVLIGINDYLKSPLRYCANDVIELKKRLINNCLYAVENIYEIVSTKDASVSNVYEKFVQIVDMIKQKFVAKSDNILFYFSGHGKFEVDQTYLEFHEELVSTQMIYEQMSAMVPANQVYILDACHSGFGIEFKSGDSASMDAYYQQRYIAISDGLYFLCSCKQDEKSQAFHEYKNGVFTKYIVEAIDNSSIYDSENNFLSLPVIHEYALKKILLTGKYKQTPFMQMQASGYYPFAVKKPEESIFCDSVVESFSTDTEIEDFFRREDLNLSKDLRRDLFHFCSELILNLFGHGYSPNVQISIAGNTVSICDFSEKSFNPFVAEPTTDGLGIKIIKDFMDRYKSVCNFSYEEGSPNTTTLSFSKEVAEFKYDAPCFIAIENESLKRPENLNTIKFDKNCKQLVIDATNALVWGSMGGLFMDYLISRTEDNKTFIILKLDKNDFTKQYLIPMTKINYYSRIMIV